MVSEGVKQAAILSLMSTRLGGHHLKTRQGQPVMAKSDRAIYFTNVAIGFQARVRGDHHIIAKTGVAQIINIQPKGAKAKSCQVKQVRSLIIKYGLGR